MIKFATIGTGWIADTYIRSAAQSNLWEFSAVYSRSKEKGLDFAKNYGVSLVYDNIEEFAKSDEFSAVYVASPNAFHYEQCKLLLNSGKHVICEKPLVTYSHQAKELYDLAEKNNVVFMEAIIFMHQESKKVLKKAVSKIGDISMATFDFCQRSSKLDDYLKGQLPNIFNPKMHTGSLMDLGIYCLYPALYLFGEPDSYNVIMNKMATGADGSGVVTLVYPNKLVNLRFSKLGQAAAHSDILGTDGSIFIPAISQLGNSQIIYKDGLVEDICGVVTKEDLMCNEATSFYNFIKKPEENHEFFIECRDLSILVCEYLEKFRKAGGLDF